MWTPTQFVDARRGDSTQASFDARRVFFVIAAAFNLGAFALAAYVISDGGGAALESIAALGVWGAVSLINLLGLLRLQRKRDHEGPGAV